MRSWLAVLPVAALLALVAMFAGSSLHRAPKIEPMAVIGHPASAIVLSRLTGGAAPVRSLVRGPTLINFYASWCAPCVKEAPALMALKAEGVRIVGVAYEDKPEATEAFLRRFGNPYAEVLLDPDGRAGVDFGTTGVPETYAVDAGGVIRAKSAQLGGITAADAEALLEKAGK